MKKIVIASGKGGVGKSMLASTLTMLFAKSKKVVAVDCDVDAPNLHLWLGEDENWDEVKKISVSEKPVFDFKKCTGCGRCFEICAFEALRLSRICGTAQSKLSNKKPVLNKFFCEGCGACEAVCPQKAIEMKPILNAEIRIKKNLNDLNHLSIPLISAQLYPGQTGSGKIVDQIKEKAERFDYEVMILDSPAGTGCPVIAALNGTDFAILITEPTPSGFSDMKRVLTVVNHFKIPYAFVINKWDINPTESSKIEEWVLRQAFGPSLGRGVQDKLLGRISYDKQIFQAIANLKPIVKTDLLVRKEIEEIHAKLEKIL